MQLSVDIKKITASSVIWLRSLMVMQIMLSAAIYLPITSGSAWAEIYVHQQQDGTRKYTDQPTHGAQKIQLPTPIMVPSNHQYSPVSALRNNKKPSQRYQSVHIVAPANDVIIRKNSGNVLLKVVIVPDQVEQFNDQIVFMIDQHEIARGQARSVTINNMDRGTHEIQVDIEDAHGNTLHSSKKQKFHLQRYRQGQ